MELQINLSDLRKRSLLLCVPMYGGQCHGIFAKSVADLSAKFAELKVQLATYFLFNESLIQRARNYCADEFRRSGFSHMLFIDSDIGFNPDDVITMLAMMSDDSEYDIVCGPYAKKCITWEKIKFAVDKGLADENPNALEMFVGDYVFNPTEGTTSINLNEPAEVLESGTGFMMIRRSVFDNLEKAYPEKLYRPDHVRTAAFDGSREIMAFFDCPIDPKTKRYLSEDYHFCQSARDAGMKVWLCPWMKLQHAGSYIFGAGGLEAIATLGVTPTADINEIAKTKK